MTTTDTRPATGADRELTDPRAALPLWPWTALHAATGMLLGSDDFEVLMGNPRGKHQLHNAWLHGRGVVWGLGVRRRGEWDLEVSPGLALDGVGHELHLNAPRCVSIRETLEADHDPPATAVRSCCAWSRVSTPASTRPSLRSPTPAT